jgi:alcohol dehydrogenase class IV
MVTLLLQCPRVHFGFGAIHVLSGQLSQVGITRPLFITDLRLANLGLMATVRTALTAKAEPACFDEVPENPTIEGVDRAFAVYRASGCDGVVALGGGSVIDTAKAVCVLATHPGPFAQYAGHPEKLGSEVAPLVAIPTTAGTGSEASPGAGIHPDATSRTIGLVSPMLVPKVAICDPGLTLSMPPRLTAGTGMDALSHCVEGFLSKTVNPPLDAIALDGVGRVFAWLERAVRNGQDREARWQMMMAALEGGMAISMGLGAAHALANTFGNHGLHHGALCTVSLPVTLRLLGPHVPEKMQRLASAMGLKPGSSPAQAVEELTLRVELPKSLRQLGYPVTDVDELAGDAAGSFFNGPSPYSPSTAEYKEMILEIAG